MEATIEFNGFSVENEENVNTENNNYKCTLIISCKIEKLGLIWNIELISISNNSQTGEEVDTQRENEAMEYINTLNSL